MRITYQAVPNGREGHGWVPAIWVNGRRVGSRWYAAGLDRDEAETQAGLLAKDEAGRYVGDWNITTERKHDTSG